ncbi:glyceraldehyde 3-phosphate dehydrogenase NAD-binding domain-containing protein [Streptomyces virginiae]|uniref:glyceraldehyde 3-phosphate dehydrogenase NAD-binding domain-containing protein n=1 Tax=Streptomyces virginiae TaxID=1961 RepID=UPI003F4D0C2F
MTVRIGINGFGRIGRNYLRCVMERAETSNGTPIEVVAVNDLTSPAALAHLLTYDSTYGRLHRTVDHDGESITVDGHRIAVTSRRDPADLGWDALGVDVVIEATGRFRTKEEAGRHLTAGARKVLLSVPGKGVEATIVRPRLVHRGRPADAGQRRPGQGLRLVRQRMGLHEPSRRPDPVRRHAARRPVSRRPPGQRTP